MSTTATNTSNSTMICLMQSETLESAEMPQTPLQQLKLQSKKSFDDDHKYNYISHSPSSKSLAYNPMIGIALGPKLNTTTAYPFDNSPSYSFSAAPIPLRLKKYSLNSPYMPDDTETPIPPSIQAKLDAAKKKNTQNQNGIRITLNCQETFPYDASPSLSAKEQSKSPKLAKSISLNDTTSSPLETASCHGGITPIVPSPHQASYSIDDGNDQQNEDENDESCSDSSDFSMFGFLEKMEECDEDIVLMDHGYERIKKICDTLQGELILASSENKNYGNVAIKKTDKKLHKQSLAEYDGMTWCVKENIILESKILRHLTVDCACPCAHDNIVEFIDYFESEDAFFLVIEYVESEINLEEFVNKAYEFMHYGKLKKKEYQRIIKKIMWQLCCHLDINLENILLQNADFVINALDGTVSINKNINVKLCDFGRSEIFKDGVFECAKPGMSCLEDGYSFDARKTDVFDLGMCLYHCCVGIAHEHKEENDDDIASDVEIETNGHSAVRNGQLNEVIKSKIRNKKIENLLSALLKMDENERFEIADVLRHEWFAGYYAKSEKRIHKRSKSQKIKYLKQLDKMNDFPFYDIDAETCPIGSDMIMIQ